MLLWRGGSDSRCWNAAAVAAAAAIAAAEPQLPASRTRQYFIFDAVVIDASNLSPCD